MAGQQWNRLLQRLRRLGQARILLERAAQNGPCVAVLRAQRHGLFQLHHRVIELAKLHVEDAQRIGRILQVGVHLAGAAQFGDCILVAGL